MKPGFIQKIKHVSYDMLWLDEHWSYSYKLLILPAYVLLDDVEFGFDMQVRVCNGKPVTIVASQAGFYPSGKRALLSRSLVGLLQQTSRAFDGVSIRSCMTSLSLDDCLLIRKSICNLQAYKALMKAFVEHNKVMFITKCWDLCLAIVFCIN